MKIIAAESVGRGFLLFSSSLEISLLHLFSFLSFQKNYNTKLDERKGDENVGDVVVVTQSGG